MGETQEFDSGDEEDNLEEEKEKNVNEMGKPIYGRINTEAIPSPLAWACFKGHL